MKVLVTGATGFLGRHLVKHLLSTGRSVVAFARSEHGHEALRSFIGERNPGDGLLDSVIGDVRDFEALLGVIDHDVSCVIHAAAQKCVPWAEKCPEEAVKTNVQGTINVARACQERGIKKALYVSSDKVASPCNTYGASKYLGEKVWSVGPSVRFGNLWGSTGSVVYSLLAQKGKGELKITHMFMDRFHIRVGQAVSFALKVLEEGKPGEIWVPLMRSYGLLDLAKAVDPDAVITSTGPRRGEKIHEELFSDVEFRNLRDRGDHFIIDPSYENDEYPIRPRLKKYLTVEELRLELEILPCGSGATAATPR